MNTFPLLKTKVSNEHMMAGVFIVLVLYHVPFWLEKPSGILRFLLLVGVGLLLDIPASFMRYKRIWCCVSGAVTAAMVSLLSVSVPLWGQIVGVVLALILGKHFLGGTGKNFINPALTGMLFVFPYFGIPDTLFSVSWLSLPALLLGLVFLTVRPYAGISFILGMLAAMSFRHELTLTNIMVYGVLFWGCLVLTDPVTVTPNPTIGSIIGFLSGLLPILLFQSPVAVFGGAILAGPISVLLTKLIKKSSGVRKAKAKIPKVYAGNMKEETIIDLTGEGQEISKFSEPSSLTKGEILKRISKNGVFGMGGAAFSTNQKLRTVMEAEVKDKYLIINAVECDPGLIHDKWLLHNCFSEIEQGVDLLLSCVDFKSVVLAVKDENVRSGTNKIHIKKVASRYPIGAEKILIEAVLKQRLPFEQIPAAAGILVLNVQTVHAICRAVLQNKQINARYLTVANLFDKKARVVKVPLGMKLHEIMEVVYPGTVNIFSGGGIMQSKLTEEDAVVEHNTNFIATGRMPNYKESPQCSKCGECSRNCPSGLPVKQIADYVDMGMLNEATKYDVNTCLSCGSCSYFCPAGRNLAERVKSVKELMNYKRA